MIDLSRLFTNWFSNKNFTPTRKLSFADDTRSRIAANNGGGEFDVLLPLLDAAIVSAGGTTGSENVAKAVRRAAVIGKRTFCAHHRQISNRAGHGPPKQIHSSSSRAATAYRQITFRGPRGTSRRERIWRTTGSSSPPTQSLRVNDPELMTDLLGQPGSHQVPIEALDHPERVIFTAALAFVGNPAMGPILFDQSKLYAPGQSPEPDPEPEPPVES